MPLPLTKEMLATSYDYLVTTPPFSRWNLPDSEDVSFKVTKSKEHYARYVWDGTHCIEVSAAAVGHTATLMEKMAHEIIHLHLRLTGMESRSRDPNVHNAAFRKFAAIVCKVHGFDSKSFW